MNRATLDFETEAIDNRPRYPPKPVGLAHHLPGRGYFYEAWGHASGNGSYALRGGRAVKLKDADPLKRAKAMLREARKCDSILGHNLAKFDCDVSETHLAIKMPSHKVDDSLWTRALVDPHAPTLSLKPSAERVLGEAPDERDAVFDWLAEHGIINKPKIENGRKKYQKDAGAHISKAPGDLVAAYAIGDLTRSEGLFDHDMKIIRRDGMYEAYLRERAIAPILLENERQGLQCDVSRLERDIPIAQKALAKVEAWLRKRLGPVENFGSSDDVIQALRKSGVVKEFPKTPTGRDSKSKSRLTAEFYSDPDVYRALVYRDLTAYVLNQNMLPWAQDGHIWTIWNQVRSDREDGGGARSLRITCSKLGNIIKDPTGGKNPDYLVKDDERIRKKVGDLPPIPLTRKYVLPDEGGLFIHNDANQEEIRITAHYEDAELASAYNRDPRIDIHKFATDTINTASGQGYVRAVIKHVNLRMFYGGGRDGLITHPMLRLDKKCGCRKGCVHTEERCAAWKAAGEIVSNWRKGLPGVVRLMDKCRSIYGRGEPIRTFGGRLYRVKPPGIAERGARKGEWVTYEYTALNYLIQPSAADFLRMWMIAYHNHPKRQGRMLCVVHDEINVSAPKKLAKQEQALLKDIMENSVKMDVPWVSEGDIRPNWGEKA